MSLAERRQVRSEDTVLMSEHEKELRIRHIESLDRLLLFFKEQYMREVRRDNLIANSDRALALEYGTKLVHYRKIRDDHMWELAAGTG